MHEPLSIVETPSSNGKNGPDRLHVETAVRERYSAASQQTEPALCCPVEYDDQYLDVLPRELIERDYGCGNPSKYIMPGETVLDLGCGGGKICYIAAQIVGREGRAIGVDVNDDMLALARQYQTEVGETIGYHNTKFHKGRIQDLALDLEAFERYLADDPIRSSSDWLRAEAHAEHLRHTQPMIADDSIDVIVSNCVLNLVDPRHRRQLFAEMYRVLKRGGRAVISDIVSDEPVPEHLRNDPQLWSGCLSGAFVEDKFFDAFTEAGFYGMEIVSRQQDAWATVEGIEFRSVTVRAFKGKDGPCMDHNQAVIYNGPWKSVVDDDGHTLRRGVRTAVCKKTFAIYNRPPYAQQITPIEPNEPVADEDAVSYDCRRNATRHPRESKGQAYDKTELPAEDCCGGSSCC